MLKSYLITLMLAGAVVVEAVPADGSGRVEVSGELRQWHKITLTLDGPYAHESAGPVNPFTDLKMDVRFVHESGIPEYVVPAYFAADGKAAESSAQSGTKWRAHLSPDRTGIWRYEILFKGTQFHGLGGSFEVGKSNKTGRDLRAKGRIEYVGERYLKHAGNGQYFLKVGPDAPETMLGYADIDNVGPGRPNSPIKNWKPHVQDWRTGDPVWHGGCGRGLIGGLNYLASKGLNAYSLLTYNADGDGDAVWPYLNKQDKLRFDCSKLDQWGVIFDHGEKLGLMLHIKLQETENDDVWRGHNKEEKMVEVPAALDGGNLGPERKLYLRELVARYGYLLGLEWNIGEENSQSPEQVRAMTDYLATIDPYPHNIVIHNFPGYEKKTFGKQLGNLSKLSGASVQVRWDLVHQRTLEWINKSTAAGRPWVVANDEQNSAKMGVPPDPGYKGFSGIAGGPRKDGKTEKEYTLHDIRKYTLWGNLMAGGAGVMYYFGYDLPENDMNCEDWRSRDRSWDYCRIAHDFFFEHQIPFWAMENADALVGNPDAGNSRYCFAKEGDTYLVYLPKGGEATLQLNGKHRTYKVSWFNPREGGALKSGSVRKVRGGATVELGAPPADPTEDWVVLVRKK